MFWKDFLFVCLSWPAALEHGKKEENTINSGIFEGLGREGNWKHCNTLYSGTALWRQMCKLLCFEGNHCKNMQTHAAICSPSRPGPRFPPFGILPMGVFVHFSPPWGLPKLGNFQIATTTTLRNIVQTLFFTVFLQCFPAKTWQKPLQKHANTFKKHGT